MSASSEDRGPDTIASAHASARRNGDRFPARHWLEHILFRAAAGGVRMLRPRSSAAFGTLVARAYFAMARARRRILLKNLAVAFPEKGSAEIAALARRSIESFGQTFVGWIDSTGLSQEELLDRVSVAGEEHLFAARSRGKGVFLLSAHFGNWEFGALRAGLMGEPISSVVRPLDNPRLERELAHRRTRFGNRVIQKKEAAREILRAMRRNETVAILVDQNVIIEEAIFVPFFGRSAATTPSLALLQLKSGASVVPVFTWPIGAGRFRLQFEPPILPEEFDDARLDRDERVRIATARYMAVTESAIRKQPEAWLWMHDRWRTRPRD